MLRIDRSQKIGNLDKALGVERKAILFGMMPKGIGDLLADMRKPGIHGAPGMVGLQLFPS